MAALQALDARERRRFEEFVHSPFFNKHEKIRALWHLLDRFLSDGREEEPDKRAVFRELYPREAYDEYKLNNLFSDLLQLCYEFLLVQRFQGEDQRRNIDLLAVLQERDLDDHLGAISKRYLRRRKRNESNPLDFFLREYQYYEQMDTVALTNTRREYDVNLQWKNNALDQFYFLNKLRIACDMTSRNQVVKAEYQPYFLAEVMTAFGDNLHNIQELGTARVFFNALQMLQNPDQTQYYFELKSSLNSYGHQFDPVELRNLYHYALNHCVQKINSGQTAYYEEILYLYKTLLEKGILLTGRHLSQWAFTNIITAGIRLQQYDWTENFIQQYQSYLAPLERVNVYNYNLAALFFEKGEWTRALQQLHKVVFTDAFYHMAAKLIQLKCFYELNETEAFLSLSAATGKFIRRNRQLSDYQKNTNFGFLKIATRAFHLRQRRDYLPRDVYETKCRQLQENLKVSEQITNKNWLEKKCRELQT